jgi:hypothetical protein
MGSGTRQLHFNAFLMSSGHHEAAWQPASRACRNQSAEPRADP